MAEQQMMLFLENKDYKKPDGFIPLELALKLQKKYHI